MDTHLQPREEAHVHEGVHILQVLIDVEGRDESCGERREGGNSNEREERQERCT